MLGLPITVAEKVTRKSMLKNSGWLFYDKIIRQGLSLLLGAYIARYLGVTEFGRWSYAIAFVALYSFLSTFGLYNILLRDFLRFPDKVAEIIGSAITLRLVGGGLVLILSLASIVYYKPEATVLHVLVVLTALNYLAQSFDVIDYYFQAGLRSNQIALARSISFLVFAVARISLVYFKYSVSYFAAVQVAELLLSGLILALLLHQVIPFKELRVRLGMIKQLVRDAWPILFAEIAIIIYMRTDQLLVAEMLDIKSLGNYSAAVRISELWYFIPTVICGSFLPSLVSAHSVDIKDYNLKVQQLYDILTGVGLIAAGCISLSSYWIIIMLFGPEYKEAFHALTIHVWAGIFVSWGLASNQQLVLEGLTHICLYRTIIGMLVNFLLNIVLIPRIGISGSAIATLIAQGFSTWVSALFFVRTRPFFWIALRSMDIRRFIFMVFALRKGNLS